MVIKDKIFDVIIRNNIESVYVSECIVKWLLYKNQIYRRFRVVKKNLGLLNKLIEKSYVFIEKNMDF